METKTFIRKRIVIAFLTVAAVMLVMCAVLGATMSGQEQNDMPIVLAVLVVLTLFFALVAWIEYRSCVIMDGESIRINYSVFSDDRALNGKKIRISYDQVEKVRRVVNTGDGVMVHDTAVYQFCLKDGRKVLAYFNQFGVNTEREIVTLLSEKVNVE